MYELLSSRLGIIWPLVVNSLKRPLTILFWLGCIFQRWEPVGDGGAQRSRQGQEEVGLRGTRRVITPQTMLPYFFSNISKYDLLQMPQSKSVQGPKFRKSFNT